MEAISATRLGGFSMVSAAREASASVGSTACGVMAVGAGAEYRAVS